MCEQQIKDFMISETKSDINKILLELNLNIYDVDKNLESILKLRTSKKKLKLLKEYSIKNFYMIC